jgi:hypothetical protein
MIIAFLWLTTLVLGAFCLFSGYRASFWKDSQIVPFALFCLVLILVPIIIGTNIYGDPVIPTASSCFLAGWLGGLGRRFWSGRKP